MSEEEKQVKEVEQEHEFSWMIRPCMIYKDERDECTSIRGRFHQYFIFGKTLDCTQWKTDYQNCYQWEKYKSKENQLIKSEKKRRLDRLRPHYQNNVWEKRQEPPKNWNAPLPEWMQKEFENTYLQIRSQEMKQGSTSSKLDSKCTIL